MKATFKKRSIRLRKPQYLDENQLMGTNIGFLKKRVSLLVPVFAGIHTIESYMGFSMAEKI